MDHYFLLELALILFSTKLLGLITRRVALPQVVGALLAGLLLGPAMLGILHETALLSQLAELGVIVLMFNAGLETDVTELRRSGKSAFIIALIGVLVPLAGGFALTSWVQKGAGSVLENVFIGVILTATSVSITVETLKEIGKLSTKSGNAILGAAIIDDVLGIVALTIITSMAGEGVDITAVLLKILAFFAVSVIAGLLLHKLIEIWFRQYEQGRRRFAVFAFAFCLLYSYLTEELFGVADITGAYVAGLIFSKTPKLPYLQSRFDTISYLLLSPVFFASIGIKVSLPAMDGSIVLFSVLLILVAILSKILGCGLGAKLCGYSDRASLRIGVGMISRGEVALIVADKGISSGLMPEQFFGPVVITVIATTILTPILLKLVYGAKKDYSELADSALVNRYEDVHAFDAASQTLLEDHEALLSGSQSKKE